MVDDAQIFYVWDLISFEWLKLDFKSGVHNEYEE